MTAAHVAGLAKSDRHGFSKQPVAFAELIAGHGVAGDAHAGKTVKHRSRVAVDPGQPNLRQVHLLHAELLDELADQGFAVMPGQLGENILTEGVDLLALPRDTILTIGKTAKLLVTGLRNPCSQIENFAPGLLGKVAYRDNDGNVVRRAGIMSVVLQGGKVTKGDRISITPPKFPHISLERV